MVKADLAAIRSLIDDERLGACLTFVRGPMLGSRAVVDADAGVIAGELPGEIREDVLADASGLMGREESRALEYGDHTVFIETIAPEPELVVFGAVHIAQALTPIAKQLGFRVTVSDARPAFTTPERFPDADRVLRGWPGEVLDRIRLDRRTFVVVLSHDARLEDPVLAAALRSPVRYIGAMGSRRTHARRVERLERAGFDSSDIERIHGPVGLDIGAHTPAETAISILAQIIHVRYGAGSALSLRGREERARLEQAERQDLG